MADAVSAMNHAVRQGALDGLGLAGPAGVAGSGGAMLSEVTPRLSVVLRGPVAAAQQMANALTGLKLPTEPRTSNGDERGCVLWLGPDEWLMAVSRDELPVVSVPEGAAFVDVSDSYTVIRVAGPNAVDVLAKSVSVDLHPDAFPPGGAVRTAFARITATVHRVETDVFDVVVTRSFSRYAWQWLVDSATEYSASHCHA